MPDKLVPCPHCAGNASRYDLDPQGMRRYAMVFDGEEGWIMLPDPAGEYVKFDDLTTSTTSEEIWRDGLDKVTPKPAHADAVLEDAGVTNIAKDVDHD